MKIIGAETIPQKKGTYLIYCPPGTGKTTTLGMLPGKTLVVDVDRTSHVLRGSKNIDITYLDNTATWAAWKELLKDLTQNYAGKYDNICIDNLSELERCILADFGRQGKNDGVPAQLDYQKLYYNLEDSLRFLKKCNSRIFLTAWEAVDLFIDVSGAQYNRAMPKISPKILDNICGLCDVVARLGIDKDGGRGFYLSPTPSVYAKNQLDSRKGCKQEELVMDDAAESVSN